MSQSGQSISAVLRDCAHFRCRLSCRLSSWSIVDIQSIPDAALGVFVGRIYAMDDGMLCGGCCRHE